MKNSLLLSELEAQGELEYEEILEAIKKADIVISALAYPQVMDQLKIIEAIKVAGNIKVYFFHAKPLLLF